MKLTLVNIRDLKKQSESPLFKRVCNYVISEWGDYIDKTNIFKDVLYHGCRSGMVGFLIYYSDTVKFYNQYREEIDDLLYKTMEETGLGSPIELFGEQWDKEDPLGREMYNQNLLAWFGFEETLRKLGYEFEQLQEVI